MGTNDRTTNQPGDPSTRLLLTSVRRQSFANSPTMDWSGWHNMPCIWKKYHSGVVTTTRAPHCGAKKIYVPLLSSLSSDWTFLSDFQEIFSPGWKIVLLSQSLSHSLVVSGKHFKTPPCYPLLHFWWLQFLEEAITFTFLSNILFLTKRYIFKGRKPYVKVFVHLKQFRVLVDIC